ncbi:MAG: F-type H+-transporting ATPase subunit epsilon [Solirubrobacterales bacterium]|nr:F-type H+-transporting ATPase subunit epsilon [Solirubrobacterales bacterium]
MAHPSFAVHVLTPDGDVYEGEVQQVSTRTGVGEVGILSNHAPMLARLVPAELRLHVDGGETLRYAQGEGWLEVFANEARVLVSEAIAPDDLDVGSLRERLADAEARRDEAEEGSVAREQAEREVVRAEAFIKIAESL